VVVGEPDADDDLPGAMPGRVGRLPAVVLAKTVVGVVRDAGVIRRAIGARHVSPPGPSGVPLLTKALTMVANQFAFHHINYVLCDVRGQIADPLQVPRNG